MRFKCSQTIYRRLIEKISNSCIPYNERFRIFEEVVDAILPESYIFGVIDRSSKIDWTEVDPVKAVVRCSNDGNTEESNTGIYYLLKKWKDKSVNSGFIIESDKNEITLQNLQTDIQRLSGLKKAACHLGCKKLISLTFEEIKEIYKSMGFSAEYFLFSDVDLLLGMDDGVSTALKFFMYDFLQMLVDCGKTFVIGCSQIKTLPEMISQSPMISETIQKDLNLKKTSRINYVRQDLDRLVGGMKDVKQKLEEMILNPLLFKSLYNLVPTRKKSGILLHGPSGCGKTLISKSFCEILGIGYTFVKGPELVKKYIGGSEQSVREIFNIGRRNSPYVLIFDEFESVAPKRYSHLTQEETITLD